MILIKEKMPAKTKEISLNNFSTKEGESSDRSLSPLYENSTDSGINNTEGVQYEAIPLTFDDKFDDPNDWRRILKAGGCTLREESFLMNLFSTCKSYQELVLRIIDEDEDYQSDKYDKSEVQLNAELEKLGGYNKCFDSSLLKRFSIIPSNEEDLKRDILQ